MPHAHVICHNHALHECVTCVRSCAGQDQHPDRAARRARGGQGEEAVGEDRRLGRRDYAGGNYLAQAGSRRAGNTVDPPFTSGRSAPSVHAAREPSSAVVATLWHFLLLPFPCPLVPWTQCRSPNSGTTEVT